MIYETATDPLSCAKVPRSALGFNDNDTDTEAGWEVPNLEKAIEVDDESTERFVWNKELQLWIKTPPGAAGIFGDNDMPGSCRWDFHRASVYKTDQACLCPATEQTCGKSERCWWYEVPDKQSKLFPQYACLNNAERFYYLLQKLLKKRGKNDFAIKINYSGHPALENPFKSMDGGLLQRIMMMRMLSQIMQKSSSYNSFNQGYYSNNYNKGYYSSRPSNYNQGYYGSNNNNNYDGYYSQANSSYPSYNYNYYYPAASDSSYYN